MRESIDVSFAAEVGIRDCGDDVAEDEEEGMWKGWREGVRER